MVNLVARLQDLRREPLQPRKIWDATGALSTGNHARDLFVRDTERTTSRSRSVEACIWTQVWSPTLKRQRQFIKIKK
jgi:hypothetical protein